MIEETIRDLVCRVNRPRFGLVQNGWKCFHQTAPTKTAGPSQPASGPIINRPRGRAKRNRREVGQIGGQAEPGRSLIHDRSLVQDPIFQPSEGTPVRFPQCRLSGDDGSCGSPTANSGSFSFAANTAGVGSGRPVQRRQRHGVSRFAGRAGALAGMDFRRDDPRLAVAASIGLLAMRAHAGGL